MTTETKMARAWTKAAKDLQIEFVSPYRFAGAGHEFFCCGFLPQFGGGMLIVSREQPDFEEQCGFDFDETSIGLRAAGLSPQYETYDRQRFIDALRNWGWDGGAASRPVWYLDATQCGSEEPCQACMHRDGLDPSICSTEKPCAACRFYNGG